MKGLRVFSVALFAKCRYLHLIFIDGGNKLRPSGFVAMNAKQVFDSVILINAISRIRRENYFFPEISGFRNV